MSRGEPLRGTLHVVATPIGHLGDLTFRARTVLTEASLIACEDTRRTRALLARYGLKARLISCHRFNEAARLETILDVLRRGESAALVSDGGTPTLSDPGALLVRRVREEGHRVVPVPGASAITALMSVSGFPDAPFTFVGFLPHRRGERRRRLTSLRDEARPLLFFESPHRLTDTLHDALEILGDRRAFLGREMTKVHEEFRSGTLATIRAAFTGRAVKGEIAFLVDGAEGRPGPHLSAAVDAEPVAQAVRRLIDSGCDRGEAMRRVARERGLSRREVYREVLQSRNGED